MKPPTPMAARGAAGKASAPAGEEHHVTFFGASRLVIAVLASAGLMAVSSGLILLNSHLLSHGFHFPMALAGLGMAFSGLASFLVCRVFRLVEARRTVTPRFFAVRIMPVGLFMALTLHFGNLVYLHLTVSFIQMLKAFTPIITMLFLFAAGLETPTRRLIVAVSFIALGTGIASAGAGRFSWLGLGIMLLSEATEAIRLVMTQLLLTGLKFHPMEGLMYLGPACLAWLVLGSAILEWPTMAREGALAIVAARPAQFALAAVMGFGVNSLAYVVIQTASSLTLKVLGTVKNAVVVWIGIVFLHEPVSALQAVGYAISLVAFFWYNRIKMHQVSNGTAAGGGAGGDKGGDRGGPSLGSLGSLAGGGISGKYSEAAALLGGGEAELGTAGSGARRAAAP